MAGFRILHNSYLEHFRKPFGAVTEGTGIRLRLSVETEEKEKLGEVKLLSWKDGDLPNEQFMKVVKEEAHLLLFEAEIIAPEKPGLLWYCFRLNLDGNNCFYGNNEGQFGGIGHGYIFDPKPYQITVYKTGFHTPDWIKNGAMYQIFPDRFARGKAGILSVKKNSFLYANWEDIPHYVKDEKGNITRWDFFGGNLEGVIEKLDYIAGLGVNVIYLNPIFEARSNHKYDTGDYKKIDPMLGSEETFQKLCREAEKRGIRLILDGVFSHTGADSRYFNKFNTYDEKGAYQSQDSPYYSWFRFRGSRDDYESWWGVADLPNVNEEDPSYQQYIFGEKDSVVRHWLKAGASGWRLDVADELPDEFINSVRTAIKEENPENLLIGEVWEDATNKISYEKRRTYLLGEGLDGVMNYPYRNNLISYLTGRMESGCFYRRVMNLKENYPVESFYALMNMSSTHDSVRLLTILGEAPDGERMTTAEKEAYCLADGQRDRAVKRLKQYFAFIGTIPGFPSILYGDEVGVEGFKDPLNRKTFPWGTEDIEIQDWLRFILTLRKNHDVLRTGDFIPFYLDNDIFGYLREITTEEDVFKKKAKNGRFLMLFNRDMVEGKIFRPHQLSGLTIVEHNFGVFRDVISGTLVDFHGKGELKIPPNGVLVLEEISGLPIEKRSSEKPPHEKGTHEKEDVVRSKSKKKLLSEETGKTEPKKILEGKSKVSTPKGRIKTRG